MSREDLHFRLRLPPDLKAHIETSAKANGRSMTAEIVAALRDDQRSLRDWFAGQALSGLIAAGFDKIQSTRSAYESADAMLAYRVSIDSGEIESRLWALVTCCLAVDAYSRSELEEMARALSDYSSAARSKGGAA